MSEIIMIFFRLNISIKKVLKTRGLFISLVGKYLRRIKMIKVLSNNEKYDHARR